MAEKEVEVLKSSDEDCKSLLREICEDTSVWSFEEVKECSKDICSLEEGLDWKVEEILVLDQFTCTSHCFKVAVPELDS